MHMPTTFQVTWANGSKVVAQTSVFLNSRAVTLPLIQGHQNDLQNNFPGMYYICPKYESSRSKHFWLTAETKRRWYGGGGAAAAETN